MTAVLHRYHSEELEKAKKEITKPAEAPRPQHQCESIEERAFADYIFVKRHASLRELAK